MAISDAKLTIGLPAGAVNIRKSDGTQPTIRYTPVGPNLLTNGDFETDVTGWTSYQGGSIARDTTTYLIGAASAKVTKGTDILAMFQEFTIRPGVTYLIAGWARGGTSQGYLEVFWKKANGASTGQNTQGPAVSDSTWTYFQSAITAPADAVTLSFHLRVSNAGHAFFDGLSVQVCVPFVASPVAEPSSTGSTAGGHLTWDPTPTVHYDGDVKLFDMGSQSSMQLADSSYTRVYGTRHQFAGDVLVDTGILRVRFTKAYSSAGRVRASALTHGTWQAPFDIGVDTGGGTTATVKTISVKRTSRAEIVLVVRDDDGNVSTWTFRRGHHAVQVDVQRTKDAGSGYQVLQVEQNTRFVLYDASKILRDDVVTGSTQSVSGSGLVEPYALAVDASLAYLIVLAFQRKPTNLFDAGNVRWRLDSAGTTGTTRSFWLGVIPWPWLLSGSYVVEAEAMTLGTGVTTGDDADDSGTHAVLDAQNEDVYYEARGGRALPIGSYTLIVRAKDSAQVANDLRMIARNHTDSADLANATRTLTSSWAYYTLDFNVGSGDDQDTIRFRFLKDTATANAIKVDYAVIVPRTRTADSIRSVFFPRDVARNALMVSSQSEGIRRVTS